jgi:hypothetical protein
MEALTANLSKLSDVPSPLAGEGQGEGVPRMKPVKLNTCDPCPRTGCTPPIEHAYLAPPPHRPSDQITGLSAGQVARHSNNMALAKHFDVKWLITLPLLGTLQDDQSSVEVHHNLRVRFGEFDE